MPRYRGWGADPSALSVLVSQFQHVQREARPAIRRAVAAATADFVADVKVDASWSTRIPAAVKVKTSFAKARPGVTVFVDSRKAPHARAYEGMASGGNRQAFRHPVFGNREVWVAQATRPFFRPNIDQHRDKVIDAIETALIQTLPRR